MTDPLKFLVIATKPREAIPFNDVGWWGEQVDGTRGVNVAALGNTDYEFLVAIHEAVEQHMCLRDGVTAEQVDAWDAAHDNGAISAGDMSDAPYHHQHVAATMVEMQLCSLLGLDWQEYERFIEGLYDGEQ